MRKFFFLEIIKVQNYELKFRLDCNLSKRKCALIRKSKNLKFLLIATKCKAFTIQDALTDNVHRFSLKFRYSQRI